MSLHSNTYEVDPLLAGITVELVYDPFDLEGQILVNNAQGMPADAATPLQIRRHDHAKVTNAVNDQDPATNISSGINYLDLVATRHRESLTAAPDQRRRSPPPTAEQFSGVPMSTITTLES